MTGGCARGVQHGCIPGTGQGGACVERHIGPQHHDLNRLHQRDIGGGKGGHGIIHPHKDKGRLDRAMGIKTERPVLVGLRPLQALDGVRQPVHHPAQIRHGQQFVPVPKEKDHQVDAQFRVGFGHLVAGQGCQRLDRALDGGQRRVVGAKHDGHDGPAPTGEQIFAG